ncbi:MAG TPA: AsmA family protein, partial [Terriglobales bacterium]|nr:AsmA family protein [Terriglobales bacterium]
MKRSRKFLALGLIPLLIAWVALLHYFSGLAARTHSQVHQELQKFLGKQVTFDRFETRWLGGLGFAAKGFRVADDSRFAATPLVQASELELGVSLLQLLRGRVVVDSLTLKDPELQIITREDGLMNIAALSRQKNEINAFPGLRPAGSERKRFPVTFMISNITIDNGRVDFIDRSVTEPAEVQIRQVDMKLTGLNPAGRTNIKLAAALAKGVGQDVRIEGRLGPLHEGRAWFRQPLNLAVQFDSLYVPLLTRAIPFFRNKIPRELDVTGPSSLRAKMEGTLEHPKITDINLKVPLFGSSDYNAILTGRVNLLKQRSWGQAEVEGNLTLDSVSLLQLRNLPFLQQILPTGLAVEGPASVHSRFEGTWERLRMGVLIRAPRSHIQYGDWLSKAAGTVTDLRARVSRGKNGLRIHDSVLTLGHSKMTISGTLQQSAALHLRLRVRSPRSSLAGWSRLIAPLSLYRARGKIGWDMLVERDLRSAESGWSAWGNLKLTDAELRPRGSDRAIERLNAEVRWSGKTAHLEQGSFRLGRSIIMMSANVPNLADLRGSYELRSPELNLSDLPPFPAGLSNDVKNMTAVGDFQLKGGSPLLQGTVYSPQGLFQEIPYRDLKATIAWAPTGISFKDLSVHLLDATLKSDGYWVSDGKQSQRLEIASQIDSANIQAWVERRFPQLKNRFHGQLGFHGHFSGASQDGTPIMETLTGSGELFIHQGSITDFNLLRGIFSQEPSGSIKTPFRLPASLTRLMARSDTAFDDLKVNLKLSDQQLHAENFLLSAPDYIVTGSGSVEADWMTKWNGALVFSSQVSQDLQHEYKTIR